MRTKDVDLHIERHGEMLKYQKKIAPFTPTFRELMDLWGLRTVSSVYFTLNFLSDIGLVTSRGRGKKKTQFYAIER